MHFVRSIGMGAAIACGLESVPGSCICPAANASALQQSYYPNTANCAEFMIPVTFESENPVFAFPKWDDDYALEDFLAVATTRPSAMLGSLVTGTKTEKFTRQIAASFCTPKNPDGKEKNVILATHGIGQARSHWNSPYRPSDYNFVQHAISKGYSVFFYDRLGTGFSEKVSGYENQLSNQVALLQSLTSIVKSGEYTPGIGKPNKLAVMGFSFGSYVTHTAIAGKPDIADAAILTAIGLNLTGVNANGLVRSFVPRIAAQQDGLRFGELDNGYLTWVDKFAQINTYFKKPFYDIPTADFAEANKEAFAIAEFLTILNGNNGSLDASGFTGSVLAISGIEDYIVCDGYCPGIFDEPASTYYRNAKPFVPYLHPNSSHNFNFHHNATGAYQVITDFLDENLK
ncbi:uncharacterized protein Z518_00950 [Rhinocladiella mackenziei CBS 650.93]|uniref:Rhinocladiella mackenziei CBS 650.93 unplaced genomic scaffold supercont1.1, whole genome shotgun sequence n=1 Tax=Rhinocladiella mackenziei CBS 650.93 TaxID=1442369 RepID=A0A0D2IUU7_9EURO|nr:uncharacterized protein Z518_00950 [Rhinocladiella mackenziei CBS 650.93]KIX09869.1 hypothetical protein Z518_00950 [Rhinocladiella mackenziei CBS 650.93]